MTFPFRWPLSFGAAGLVSALAWRRHTLTAGGALAATLVGGLTFARGGPPAAGALLAFFASSSALSHFKQAEKQRRGVLAQAKGGQRDAVQVLANGGFATLAITLDRPESFLGALATAAADTWATELGLLSPRPPRLLTTLRPAVPGASGAVSPLGLASSAAGAFLVGAAWALFRGRGGWRSVPLALAAGSLGALADSLLGATLQAAYWCDHCQVPTEASPHPRCGRPARLVHGLPWLDNDAVNALATVCGAALGELLAPRA